MRFPTPPRPRVSIVLPVRNGARRLLGALASIRAQTELNWELIAIDDGSIDQTPQMLAAAARDDERIRIYTTTPQGIVAALNLGLAHARAPYIGRIDADDTCAPERFERQCTYLDRHPEVGVVSSLVEFVGPMVGVDGYQRHVTWLNTVFTPEEIRRKRFIESPLAHPSVVFRARLVEELGEYRDGDFPEDYELWLRWFDAGVVMAKLPDRYLHWVDSAERLSRTSPRYSVTAFYRTKATYLASWLKRELPAERPIWIWGAGRVTRSRVRWLLSEGVVPSGWIDIAPRKIGRVYAGRTVCPPEALLRAPRPFVLAYVGSWDTRDIIARWLNQHAFVEELDYLLCA